MAHGRADVLCICRPFRYFVATTLTLKFSTFLDYVEDLVHTDRLFGFGVCTKLVFESSENSNPESTYFFTVLKRYIFGGYDWND